MSTQSSPRWVVTLAATLLATALPSTSAEACPWAYPIGDSAVSPAPLFNGHPVGGGNLPNLGVHLGADYWSGGGCTDLGQTVYAVADGEIVEIVDGLGSYLDVVVIRHEDASAGTVYSMYGHISREAGLAEGQLVDYRQPIGFIDDVLAYFSPCHLHFEILNEQAYQQGPFCNGCAAAGFHVSPGYDQQAGVVAGMDPSGDTWLDVDDGIADNRWYHTDAFIDARLDATCGECGDGICEGNETYDECPADCPPCALIPPEGGTLDETGACFFAGGDPTYWNVDNDTGFESSLRWTHTTDSTIVDNYGIWSLAFAEAGQYRLEAWIEPGSADTELASYQVRHAGAMDTVVVDQSAGDGWVTLAEYEFAAEGDQWIRLDDNTGEAFSTMTRIVFDGIRLTRLDPTPGGSESGEPPPATTSSGSGADESGAPATTDDATDEGGSNATDTGSPGGGGPALPGARESEDFGCTCHENRSAPPWWALLLLPAFRRRRSKRA
ncbi:MAG: peptidoglycan DD-metalloendopeptidase family protein [Myxococcota bacterium]